MVQVSGGLGHTCALLGNGDTYCFGSAFHGQIGYASVDNVGDDETPASVGAVNVGGVVKQVSAGGGHSCAVLDGGEVRCWGLGGGGRLGYANTQSIGDDELPATAGNVDVGGRVVQVAAGGVHTCARLDTGAVRCWGANSSGELGYGNTASIGDDETPSSAGNVPLGAGAEQIAVGGNHSCALLDGGRVRCWGLGRNGQLGYGNQSDIGDDETPASAGDVDVGGTVVEIAAGGTNTCARMDTGSVRCWGSAVVGQLGYGNGEQIGDDETPASAGDVNVGFAAAGISVGDGHVCVRSAAGAVRCWGDGGGGRLGYANVNTIGDDESPASAGDVDTGGPVAQVEAGGQHSCAIMAGGALRCWGYGGDGALGYANTADIGDDEIPAAVGNVILP